MSFKFKALWLGSIACRMSLHIKLLSFSLIEALNSSSRDKVLYSSLITRLSLGTASTMTGGSSIAGLENDLGCCCCCCCCWADEDRLKSEWR